MTSLRSIFEAGGVARNGIWLASEKIVLLGKGLLLTYLLANFVDREVYGAYQFIIAYLGALSVFLLPGMGVAIVQAIAQNKAGTFAVAVKKVFTLALWGTLVLALTGGYYLSVHSANTAYVYFTLAAVFPGYAVMSFWRYYYTGFSRFSDLVKMSVFLELLSLGSMIVALIFFRNLEGLIALGIIAPIPFSLFLLWKLLRSSHHLPADDDALVFGNRISYALSLSSLAAYGDKLILGAFLGFTEVAIYGVALIIPEQAKSIAASFMTPLLPKYSASVSLQELKRHLVVTTGGALGVALFLYVLMPSVFALFFPQYLGGIEYAQWLLAAFCLLPVILLETYFRSQRDDATVVRATVAGSFASILLLLSLVPSFGIVGAISAKTGGLVVQGAMYLQSYRKLRTSNATRLAT